MRPWLHIALILVMAALPAANAVAACCAEKPNVTGVSNGAAEPMPCHETGEQASPADTQSTADCPHRGHCAGVSAALSLRIALPAAERPPVITANPRVRAPSPAVSDDPLRPPIPA